MNTVSSQSAADTVYSATVVSTASAGVGNRAPTLAQAGTDQAVALATGMPTTTDFRAAVSGYPANAAAFGEGTTPLGLLVLGGRGAANLQGFDALSTASSTFTFGDPGTLPLRSVKLGLLDYDASVNGFDFLDFTVTSGAAAILSESFLSLASAEAYFNDNVLSLGDLSKDVVNGALNLTFTMDVGKSSPDDGFSAEMVFAGGPMPAVPEPSGWILIGACLLGCVTRRGMASRHDRNVGHGKNRPPKG